MKIETVRFVGRKYRGFMSQKKKKKENLTKCKMFLLSSPSWPQ